MQAPSVPVDEIERLEALVALDVLDSPRDERFDRVTRLARGLFSVPIALVCLIDSDRQWFKSRQRLAAADTARDISFCANAIAADVPFVVADALDDPRFADNPLVIGAPHIRFYAGYPLTLDGAGQRVVMTGFHGEPLRNGCRSRRRASG